MKNLFFILSIFICVHFAFFFISPQCGHAEESSETIFSDSYQLNGFAAEYETEPKDILLAMIQDDTISAYKMAAAVRVFKKKFSPDVVLREKRIIEKILLRRLSRTDSPFVQVEIMHTLCRIDRYKYFPTMVPSLILKLDHYNSTVNELSYKALEDTFETENPKAREARIVFNTLRKVLFLSRKRLANVTEPDIRLQQKLKLIRWSIKVLGTQELERLPQEVMSLL